MCARAIHYLSPRANKPFITCNVARSPWNCSRTRCSCHESGAYTDARKACRGLIAEAEGGTLFLDEVDSLPLPAQVKLLRFLQDRQYRPLGAANYRHADTRLIAASNQNLQARVRERTFREDFYYRLKVVSLSLPSLRQRPEDVLLLANQFLKQPPLNTTARPGGSRPARTRSYWLTRGRGTCGSWKTSCVRPSCWWRGRSSTSETCPSIVIRTPGRRALQRVVQGGQSADD
jgi:DNA-binding NtrC family response regulator